MFDRVLRTPLLINCYIGMANGGRGGGTYLPCLFLKNEQIALNKHLCSSMG